MVALECVLGSSKYCQETWKQKQKTKIYQHIILDNNRKIKVYNGKYKTYHGSLS